MAPPPFVVQAARGLWHWQWLQLMGGLGPADPEGNYRRPASAFASTPPLPANAAAADAHVLIVGRSCPWAHRAWLVWSLRQLAGSITLMVVEPDPTAGRWRFSEPFEGCLTLAELYRRSGARNPEGGPLRATVPALYSRSQGRILVNESARVIELLNQWPAPQGAPDLDPAPQRQSTRLWRERLQHDVNDGVYRCGFARSQAAYGRAEAALFQALEMAEAALGAAEPDRATTGPGAKGSGTGPWLAGPELSLADVQLFPTLIRLELVYAPLFGVSRRPLWQLPALWRWRQRLHRQPGVADTCWPEAWRRDYFGALFPLHPSGIIPAGPELATLVGEPPALP